MSDEEILEIILTGYGLSVPLDESTKLRAYHSKRENLTRILKKTGNYSIALGIIAYIYLLLKKAGISISFIKAAIITGSIVTVTTLTITGTAVVKISDIFRASVNGDTDNISLPLDIPSTKFEKSLKITTFDSSPESAEAASRVMKQIRSDLLLLRGEENITNRINGSTYAVTGSVEKLPEGYLISIKIINPASGKIIFYDMAEIKSEEEIPQTCRNIARKISSRIK